MNRIPSGISVDKVEWAGLKTSTVTFAKAGLEFPTHAHLDASNLHLTIVRKGQIEVLGDQAGLILNPGDEMRWKVGEAHGFKGLTAGAVLVNISPWKEEDGR